jgi:hypothetical protein
MKQKLVFLSSLLVLMFALYNYSTRVGFKAKISDKDLSDVSGKGFCIGTTYAEPIYQWVLVPNDKGFLRWALALVGHDLYPNDPRCQPQYDPNLQACQQECMDNGGWTSAIDENQYANCYSHYCSPSSQYCCYDR